MSTKGTKWLHLILRLSSVIFNAKRKLAFAHALHAIGIGIYILVLELILLLISLPAYIFISPQNLGAAPEEIIAYKLRRKITLSVFAGSIALWVIQLSFVTFTNFYFAPPSSVSAATIGWHFNDPENYIYDKSKITITDGMVMLKKVKPIEEEVTAEIIAETEVEEKVAEPSRDKKEKKEKTDKEKKDKKEEEDKEDKKEKNDQEEEIIEEPATPENQVEDELSATPAPAAINKKTEPKTEICRSTIHPNNPVEVLNLEKWLNFNAVAQAKDGQITFQISSNGQQWYFWNGVQWAAAEGDSDSQYSLAEEINDHIAEFEAAESIFFKALLQSDCQSEVNLLEITLQYEVKKPENQCRSVRQVIDKKSCNEVGEYDESTETCTLKADINFCTDGITEGGVYIDAFGTTKNHLTLDCAGFQITGENTTGAGVSGESNMTIQNCRISGFDTGIHVVATDDVVGSKIIKNTIADNDIGLVFDGGRGGNNTIVKYNSVTSRTTDLVMSNAASNNQIIYNNFSGETNLKGNKKGKNNIFDDQVCAGNFYANTKNSADNYPLDSSWPTNTDQNLNGIADCAEGTVHEEILKWYFDEGEGKRTKDSSNNGHDGAIKGPVFTDGIIGKALQFNGDKDEVKLSSHKNFDVTDQLTFSVWAQTQDHRTAKIVQKGDWDGHGIGLDQYKGWQAHFRINGETKTIDWGKGQPELNKWYQLIATYNGQQINLYVDNKLESTIDASGPLDTNKRSFMVGSAGDNSKFFKGKIDEVLVLHNAVSSDDVKKHAEYIGLLIKGCINREGVETGDCKETLEPPKEDEIQPELSLWKLNEKKGAVVSTEKGEATGKIEGAAWANGVEGAALQFDGDDDFVSIPRTVNLDITEKITLQAWVKPERSATDSKQTGYIISKYDSKAKAGYSLVQETQGKKDRIGFNLANGKAIKHLRSKSELKVGEWAHVIGTYDGSEMSIYINGVLDTKTKYNGGLVASAGDVHFGVAAPGAQTSFQGLIDEVGISSQPTSKEQAKSIFESYPVPTPEPEKEEPKEEEPMPESSPLVGTVTPETEPAIIKGINNEFNYDLWLLEVDRGNEEPAHLTIFLPAVFKTATDLEKSINIANSKTIFFSSDPAFTKSPGPVFKVNKKNKKYTYSGNPTNKSTIGKITFNEKVTKTPPKLTLKEEAYEASYIAYKLDGKDYNWSIADQKFFPDTVLFLSAFTQDPEVEPENTEPKPEGPVCGNGKTEENEQCDAGENNANTNACLANCTTAVCGDSYLYQAVEQCDDGNLENGDGCSAVCAIEPKETCEDNIQNQDEEAIDCGGVCGACPVLPGIAPSDDTYLYSKKQDHNYGASESMFVGSQGRMLLRFDLSSLPQYAVIKSAKLSLYATADRKGAGQISTHQILAGNQGWKEGAKIGAIAISNEPTWSHKDFLTQTNWAGTKGANAANKDFNKTAESAIKTAISANQRYEFPISKELVQSWFDSPEANHGLTIRGSGQPAYFATKENANSQSHPRLIVDYEVVVPETCSDNIQNQDEEDVDCGGVCGKCSEPEPEPEPETPKCFDQNIILAEGGKTTPAELTDLGIEYKGNNTYEFTKDIELCDKTHLSLRSNVTLDGKGKTLKGINHTDGRGIFLNGVSHTTLRNLTIDGFQRNYQVWQSSDNLIENSTLQNSIYAAIEIRGKNTRDNQILRNTFKDNINESGFTGFGIVGEATRTKIYYNNFLNNRKENIKLEGSQFDDQVCAGNFFDDETGSPDPNNRKLSAQWPAADDNSNGIADCAEVQAPPKKLISHWSFSENNGCSTTDANGLNNGVLAPKCSENAPAWSKSALKFDGKDDYVNVGKDQSLMPDNFTVATWINLESLPTNTWAGILSKGDFDTGNGFELYVRANKSTTGTEPNKIAWALAKTRAFSKEIPAINKWIHVAGTYDGENIALYVNGQLQQVKAAKLDKNNLPLFIGRRTQDPKNTFHGQIDELSFYNYSLSSSEVEELFKTTPHNGTTEVIEPPQGPVCGNGVVEEKEACDDGNQDDNDQCTNACLINNPIPEGEHRVVNSNPDIKVTNYFYSDINTTPRELFIEKDLKRIAYLEINDDLDLSNIIIGNDYRKGKSWVHIPQNIDRSNLDSITLLIPRQPHHVSVRICPGATNSEEVFPGCFNEIILDPINSPSANGYTLTDLDDNDYWHVQSESVDLFSTGGEGNGDTILAHWKLDEGSGCTAADSIGSAHGTLGPSCAGNSPLWVTGQNENALDFDGTDDYIALNMSYSTSGAIDSMTACGWSKVPSGNGNGGWAILDFDRSEYFNLTVGNTTRTSNFVNFNTTGSNSTIHDLVGTTNVRDNQWHFICGVYNGTDKYIYVDGNLDATASNAHGGLNLGTGNTRFGFIGDGSEATTYNGTRNNVYYKGQIDDVSLYNFALSATEIASLYGKPSCKVVTSDNFQDNNVSDWVHTYDAGADWYLENNGGNYVYGHTSASYSQVQAPAVGQADYIINADMVVNSYGAHGILFRHTDDNNYWRLVFEGGEAKISGEVGGAPTDAAGMTPVSFTPSLGIEYHLKVQANGNELRGKWWADGDTEPTSWLISASDASLASGNIGFINRESAYYDNLTVSDCLSEPSISVTAPNGSEKLFFADSTDITWNSFDTSGNVKIEYSKDNFAGDINVITASTPDTGTYSWDVPIDASKTVRVRISDVTNASLNDISNADFEIADPDAPFVYWALNDNAGCTAADTQTNIDGTLTPTCPANAPVWTPGISGSALDFDGTDDALESASLIINPAVTTSFSASAWVNPDTFAHLDVNGDTARIFQQLDGTGVGRGWLYIHRIDPTTYRLESFIGGATLATTTNWNGFTGQWHHIALTYDGSTLKLFVDGVEEASEFRVAEASDGNMLIGKHKTPSAAAEEWDGKIDEIKFFQKALSPSEVSSLYTSTKYINVTAPNGGESFDVNTVNNITWNSVNTSGNVKIEYSKDDFTLDINEVVASTPDDGQYEWTVPTDGSTTVKVRISDATDLGTNDLSDANFTLNDPTQPLLWWKFDENTGCTAGDSISNNDGTLAPTCPSNSPTWTSTAAINSALNFDGSGDNVFDDDGENIINGLDAITVTMWLKSEVTNTDKGFLNGKDPNGADEALGIRYDASGANGGCTNCMKAAITTTSGNIQLESSNNSQTTDWQFIALTWSSGNQLKLYLNGQLDTPTSNSAGVAGTITSLTKLIVGKGGKDTGGSAGWDGVIDEFRLYNNERSAGEIADLYASYKQLSLTSPNGGESIGVGSVHNITWNSFATSGNVKIEYSKDNFAVDINEIIASTTDDGQYEWTVPNDVNSTVKIRISDAADSGFNDLSDNNFEIASIGGNLISEWKFDENASCTATDTADGNDGALGPSCSANSPAWTPGVQSSSLDFDGANDLITVTNAANINDPAKVTISAWVNHPATAQFRPILDKRDGNTDGYNLMIDDSSQPFMRINGQTLSGTTNVADGQWHHVVGVYDGSDIKLYVDGDLNTSATVGAETISTTTDLFIGRDYNNSIFYDGLIDEIRLYDRDLSALEVTNLYNLYQSIKVTAPNGGENFGIGTAQTITWNSFGSSGNVKIEYSKDNFSTDINQIIASTADTGSYVWVVPNDASSTVRIRVTDTVNPISDTSDASFTIFQPVANLISQWPLDENTGCTAGDTIGTNNGTLSPTCPANAPAWTTGQVNSALDFDATDDYVTIPDSASLDITDTLSITAWINSDAFINGDKIIHKNQAYEIRQLSNNRIRFQLWKDGGGTASATVPNNTFTPGQWYFIAATYNGSELKLYVNGAETASATNQIFTIRQSNSTLKFGSNTNGNNNFYDGRIDEVGLWDEALTATEINSLYLTGLNSIPSIAINSVDQQTDDRFVNIDYTITDNNAEAITLATFEYSLTGAFAGEQATMTAAIGDGAHQGTTGLASSAVGESHTFVWNAEADLGPIHQSTVFVRLRPQDALISGNYVNFGPFTVDTKAPAGISDFSGIISTENSITFSWMPITDEPNFDHYEIWISPSQNEVQNRFGSAIEWDNVDDVTLATKGTASTIITGLTSNTTYFAKIFAIDTFGLETTLADVSFTTTTTPTTIPTTPTPAPTGGGSSGNTSSSVSNVGQVISYYKTNPSAPTLDQPLSPRNNGTVPLSGTARENSTIEIFVNGQKITTELQTSGTSQDFAGEITLPEGKHLIEVVAIEDSRRSERSVTREVTIDRTPPAPPIVDEFAGPLQDTLVAITGSAEPYATIDLYINGQREYSSFTKADAQGNCYGLATLPAGTHKIYTIAIDAAGNTSQPSNEVTVIVTPTSDLTPLFIEERSPQSAPVSIPIARTAFGTAATRPSTPSTATEKPNDLATPEDVTITGPSDIAPEIKVKLDELFKVAEPEIIEIINRSSNSDVIPTPQVTLVNQQLFGNKIVFEGAGIPGSQIAIFIHSPQAVVYIAKVNDDGKWNISHSQAATALNPGEHSVYAITFDKNSLIKSKPSKVTHFFIRPNYIRPVTNTIGLSTVALTFFIIVIGLLSWKYKAEAN